MLLWAVVIYPALRVITPFGVNPSEWGPIVLFLVRIGYKLLLVLLELYILGRRLGRVVILLLEEGVQIVLVLLV